MIAEKVLDHVDGTSSDTGDRTQRIPVTEDPKDHRYRGLGRSCPLRCLLRR